MSWLLIAAAIAVGGLLFVLYRFFAARHLQRFIERRRSSSRIVSLGEFVDGSRRMAVALALTDTAFYYENTDMQASLDLEWIEEVGYESELSTGRAVVGGEVLRLRCQRQLFEFVLSTDVVGAWKRVMPAHLLASAAAPAMAGPLAPEFA